MKKNLRVLVNSFAASLLSTLAAVVWLCNYTVTAGQVLLITGITTVALFLPWARWLTAARLVWVVASAACFRLGIELMSRLNHEIEQWSWWLGWGLILLLFVYFGKQALYECALIPSLAVVIALLLSFGGSFGSFDDVIEWNGSPWQHVTAGVVVLLGCALSGQTLVPHHNAGKVGALTGIFVWGTVAFIPLIMWSKQALEILSSSLPQAWARLDFLSFLSCPDVLLCALCAVAALWQSAVGVCLLLQIKR